MRRVGLVLAGLGTCLLVFAVLIPTWVSGRVLKFPLNEYATVTLTDSNASYFSAAKVAEQTGVNVEATYTIKGDAPAGSSSTAVWNEFIYVYDQTNQQPIQSMTRTFAFNRRTAQLVNCCGAKVNGNSSVDQTGYVGYVLPIGTQRKTYQVFDSNVNRPEPFVYAGTGAVDGTEAYRFVETVAPTQNGTQTLPGSLVGMSQASVTLPQFYQVQTTYWIDPVTGALLNVTQNEKLTLRNSSGGQALLLFDANLAATQTSVDGLVALDNSELTKMSLVGTLLPLVTGIAGIILLVLAVLLGRRPREDVRAAAPELATEAGDATRSSPSAVIPGLDDEPREAAADGASPAAKEEEEASQPAAAETQAATPESTEAAAAAPEAKAEADPAETPAGDASAGETAAESSEAADTAAPADATASHRGRGGAHRR